MNIHEFEDLVLDADGNPFGQGFAFAVGNELGGGIYVTNLMMTESGEVFVAISSEDEPEELLFTLMVPSYEEGVVEALGFLSLHPGWILDVSEKLLPE